MKDISKILVCGLFLFHGILYGEENRSRLNKNWPAWRGPLATGESPVGNPPIEWNESKNIRWKIPIPGKGLSTPVVWGDRIFITTAIPLDKTGDPELVKAHKRGRPIWMRIAGMSRTTKNIQQFSVLSISRKNGEILWKKVVREALPHEGIHKNGSWASHSCVADGENIIAFFGSYGIYCFDHQGHLVWEKDLGDMKIENTFGEGSSPALYGNHLIVKWDHEGPSFIASLEKTTGKIIWKKERDEGSSWSTPIVAEADGKSQVIVSATECSRGYDLQGGEVIWELGGLSENVIPSPVYSDGMVYLMSGFRGNVLQAIKLDGAKGDLTGTNAVAWTYGKSTPYVPSPLIYKGKLYFLQGNKGRLTCADAKTGKIYYTKQKLEGMKGVYASPVGANDRVYIAGRNGVFYVIKQGPQFEVLAKNILEDRFDASPVVVDTELYLRGLKYLYCIAEE